MGWVSKKKCTICKKEFETDVETEVCIACLLRPTRANFAYVTHEETQRLSRRKIEAKPLTVLDFEKKGIIKKISAKKVANKKQK